MTGERLAALRAELDRLRPLAPETLRSLAAWYDVELTWSSTAIEGNTLTRSETALVLEKGLTVAGKPLRDHLEAIDHGDALHFVRSLADRTAEPVRLRDVLDIHGLVLRRSNPDDAGRLRTAPVLIAGSRAVPPPPFEVPVLMQEFGDWLAAAPDTPEAAFEAHRRLVTIHPFADGNGRTGRLLMNLKLLRGGWPPCIVRPEDRPAYTDALEAAQTGGGRNAYDDLMTRLLEASLEQLLAIARQTRAE